MFSFQSQKLNGMCLLDWQLSGYRPPVLDVFYFIFSSTNKEQRKKELPNLLQQYYKSLSEHIKELGSDPEQLFSFAQFHEELKKLGKFALFTAPFTLMLVLASADEIPEVSKFFESIFTGIPSIPVHRMTGDKLKTYKERLGDTIDDLLDYDFI